MKQKYYYVASSLLVAAILVVGCSENKEGATDLGKEVAAQRLGARAEQLEMVENHAEAAKLYDKLLKKFGNTKYVGELQGKLEAKGISMESPLVSRTSRRLFSLQNLILRYKASKGRYPKGHAISIPKDLWGNSLVYKIMDEKSKKPYEFFTMSYGPDKKNNTDDDIYVIYGGKKSAGQVQKKEEEGEEAGEEIVQTGRISSKTARFGNGNGGTVSLKDIGGLSGSAGRTGSDNKISLEELQEMGEGQKKRKSGGGEKVISLKDLLSSQE